MEILSSNTIVGDSTSRVNDDEKSDEDRIEERVAKITKHLCYMLRHRFAELLAHRKKRRFFNADAGNQVSFSQKDAAYGCPKFTIFQGGWVRLSDLYTFFPSAMPYRRDEVLEVVRAQITNEDTKLRFQLAQKTNSDEEVYIRTTYGHSFNILTCGPPMPLTEEFLSAHTLQMLCINTIIDNIALYQRLGDLDTFLFARLLWMIKRRGKFSTSALKALLSEEMEELDLSRFGPLITAGNLRLIASTCRKLTILRLRGCVVLDNQSLLFLAKRLSLLQELDLTECNYIDLKGLKGVLKNLKCLKRLRIGGIGHITAQDTNELRLLNQGVRITR